MGLDRLVDWLMELADAFRFWEVIQPYEKAVVTTLGKWVRVMGPGIHWLWPFEIDKVITENVVMTTDTTGSIDVTTKDGIAIVVSCVYRWHIRDVKKLTLDCEDSDDVLMDSTDAQVYKALCHRTWKEIYSQPDWWVTEAQEAIRRRMGRYGIVLEELQIRNMTATKVLTHHGIDLSLSSNGE